MLADWPARRPTAVSDSSTGLSVKLRTWSMVVPKTLAKVSDGRVVVAVDADPGDVARAGPPGGDRPGARLVRLERPQPGDVVGALAAEQRHDVLPRRHERRRLELPVAPRVPVAFISCPKPMTTGWPKSRTASAYVRR